MSQHRVAGSRSFNPGCRHSCTRPSHVRGAGVFLMISPSFIGDPPLSLILNREHDTVNPSHHHVVHIFRKSGSHTMKNGYIFHI